MISVIKNSNTFTSAVPVRVFIDGKESFDEKLIKSSCKELGDMLTNPDLPEEQRNLSKLYAHYDRHYSGNKSFPKKYKQSEFFRYLQYNERAFLITGPQTKYLQRMGAAIGSELKACKEAGIENSFNLTVAKINYRNAIYEILSSRLLRMAEIGENFKKFVTLNIYMKSSGKYKSSSFKMKLDNIRFTS